MATKPTIYDQAAIAVNGALLVEAVSVGIQYMDSDEAIALLGLTINGAPRRGVVVAPGGRMMTIDVAEENPPRKAKSAIQSRSPVSGSVRT